MFDPVAKKSVEQWLRRQLYIEREEGPCKRLEVRHVSVGNKVGSVVTAIDVPEKCSPEDLDGLIHEIDTATSEDAEGIGGVQKYALYPYFANREKPIGRKVFRQSGEQDENVEEMELDSEPPTAKGHLTQLMRHNEALVKQMVAMVSATTLVQNKIISRLSEKSERYEEFQLRRMEKELELQRLTEEMMSEKHEREIATERAKMKNEAFMETFRTVNSIIPVVGNALIGKKLLKEGISTEQALVKSFMDSLTVDQVSKLKHVLTEDQFTAMEPLYEEKDHGKHREMLVKFVESLRPEQAMNLQTFLKPYQLLAVGQIQKAVDSIKATQTANGGQSS